MRGLRSTRDGVGGPLDGLDSTDDLFDARVHARSRFRSQDDPTRFAVYTVHDAEAWAPPTPVSEPGDHTLIVVREFRRVPLHASALAMLLLSARPGYSAPVLAALAHFVERAVSLYQPAYLLLAHSLEQPRISALMLACTSARRSPPRARPRSARRRCSGAGALLMLRPEWFSYCPEPEAKTVTSSLVSPYAV